MERKLIFFVYFLGLIALIHGATDATIDATKTYQTIRGFGGINHPDWIDDLTEAQRAKAFNNGANDLGFTILRVYVSDDTNAWKKSVNTAKTAQSLGATIFASPWNPPSSMTEQFSEGGRSGKRLRHDKYADYANHLNNFVKFMKENGVDIYAISIQNEPDYAHDWTWWTSQECVTFLASYASKIDCKIMSPETFQYNKQYYNDILNNAQANANVDVFATHFYGTQRSQMDFPALENDPREIWMTEVYVPNSSSDADTWPEAVEVAVNMHNGLVVGSMNAYIWWYIRRSYGPMKDNGNISKRGYMMAHFSKYVRPGAVRIDATESPENGVYISAYKNTDGTIIIVAVNNGSNSYSQLFNINGLTITKVDRYKTTQGVNLEETKNLELTGNGFYAYLESKSVSTYVVS
jgi:glucuronoarabinoxylan endo-1,4-beta-xylanase